LKILFDHNLPRALRRLLIGHVVTLTQEMRWDQLKNGMLLRSAAAGGFDIFLSIDKSIEYEQNLRTLPLPVIILDSLFNTMPYLSPLVPNLLALIALPLSPALYVIQRDGIILRLDSPR
jgi:hypothetical protein